MEDGGKTVARFPFVVERGFCAAKRSTMPEMTHFLGPAIDPGQGNPVNRSLKHYERARQLIEKADRYAGAWHKLHRGFGDAMAFQDTGFKIDVQFTYLIRPDSHEVVWKRMRDKTRNVIRRAEERWTVEDWQDPEAFSHFYDLQIARRGLENYYTRVRPVCEAALGHKQGMILCARDEGRAIRAAIFVIWDDKTAYYHMSTREQGIDNGVVSLLIWTAIRRMMERGLTFDFDGVATPGSRLFFNGFGGTIEPAFVVSRYRDVRWALDRRLLKLRRDLRGRLAVPSAPGLKEAA